MKYINKFPHWRQAGDALVPPFGVSPELSEPPVGSGWEPIAAPDPAPVSVSPEPVSAVETPAEPASDPVSPEPASEEPAQETPSSPETNVPRRKKGGNS